MRVLLHTPLKPPDHVTPSGDREMARGLRRLLKRLGHHLVVPEESLVAPGVPDATTHLALERRARAQAARLIAKWHALPAHHPERYDLWFTYHCYYRKPDWLGPLVTQALGIPYVVAEASHSAKRAIGRWRLGHRAVERALAAADLVLTVNPADAPGVRARIASPSRQVELAPFIDTAPYRVPPHSYGDVSAASADGGVKKQRDLVSLTPPSPQRLGYKPRDGDTSPSEGGGIPVLLSVGMMRVRDKLDSYRVLAEALTRLKDRPWRARLVGDGPARAEVEALFAPLGKRVTFAGLHTRQDLPAIYAQADLYLWPAINEAFGMAFLEAQASGLPVVAGRTGGVPAVVAEGVTGLLVPVGDAAAFADAVARLLDDAALRARFAAAAVDYVASRHDDRTAARALAVALRRLR